jgi:hypothetical protein
MRRTFSFLSPLILVLAITQTSFATNSAESLSRKALSENSNEARAAVAELRSLGPAGLKALREQYAKEIALHREDPNAAASAEWERISTALDHVAQQKNSYLSGLYWYTDMVEARKAATQSGKPILSLRLLGKLSEDLSCANSRFFRTLLYSNATVSAALRERFILHWQSVRPAPVITIDFGDGRKLERTITGNSIHYVLDSDGRLVDALPGVYGPEAFLRQLNDIEPIARQVRGKSEIEKQALLVAYYRNRLNKLSLAWLADTTRIGGKLPAGYTIERDQNGEALSIMPLAITKAVTERTILRAMTAGAEALGRITDEPGWLKIAALHSEEARLDSQSVGLIRHQTPNLSDKMLASLLERFEKSVALDTVRNEYLMHSKIYGQLLIDRGRSDIDAFNEKVYAELFMTPRSDPWLGLLLPDTYTAIENAGVIEEPGK